MEWLQLETVAAVVVVMFVVVVVVVDVAVAVGGGDEKCVVVEVTGDVRLKVVVVGVVANDPPRPPRPQKCYYYQ